MRRRLPLIAAPFVLLAIYILAFGPFMALRTGNRLPAAVDIAIDQAYLPPFWAMDKSPLFNQFMHVYVDLWV